MSGSKGMSGPVWYHEKNPPCSDWVVISKELFGQCVVNDCRSTKFHECIQYVRQARVQPCNPYDPPKKFGKDLLRTTERKMKIGTRSLSLCTCMESRVSYLFGISAFVSYGDEIVTLRAVTDSTKPIPDMVNVIMDGGAEFPLDEVARNIALCFKKKFQRRF